MKLGQLPEVSNEQKEKFQERRHNIAALKKKVSQLSEEMVLFEIQNFLFQHGFTRSKYSRKGKALKLRLEEAF